MAVFPRPGRKSLTVSPFQMLLLSSLKRLGMRSRTGAELIDLSGARTYDPRYNQTAY
jgi:hypothetical protein